MLASTSLVVASARGVRFAPALLIVFAVSDVALYGFDFIMMSPPKTVDAFVASLDEPPRRLGDRVDVFGNHDSLILKGYKLSNLYMSLAPRRLLDLSHPNAARVAGIGFRSDETGRWHEMPLPLPRVNLVGKVLKSNDPASDLERIDPETTALAESSIDLKAGDAGIANMVVDRQGRLGVQTSANDPRLLVISESYHEGWHATIDGNPTVVLRINGDFMGCLVPAGVHAVRLEFSPWSLRVGRFVSLATLACLLVLAIGFSWAALSRRSPRTGVTASSEVAAIPHRQ